MVTVDAGQHDDTVGPPPGGHHAARAVLGWGGFVERLVAVAAIGMLLTFTFLESTDPSGPALSKLLGDVALFGLGIAFFLDILSTRVEVQGSNLSLVNPVTRTTIPAVRIARVEWADGLEIVDASGRRHGHVGYGGSVLGSLTGNRRSANVASKVEGWRTSRVLNGSEEDTSVVGRSPRTVWLIRADRGWEGSRRAELWHVSQVRPRLARASTPRERADVLRVSLRVRSWSAGDGCSRLPASGSRHP